jgi:hypothetical protein
VSVSVCVCVCVYARARIYIVIGVSKKMTYIIKTSSVACAFVRLMPCIFSHIFILTLGCRYAIVNIYLNKLLFCGTFVNIYLILFCL